MTLLCTYKSKEVFFNYDSSSDSFVLKIMYKNRRNEGRSLLKTRIKRIKVINIIKNLQIRDNKIHKADDFDYRTTHNHVWIRPKKGKPFFLGNSFINHLVFWYRRMMYFRERMT